jgi:hypothetical protein
VTPQLVRRETYILILSPKKLDNLAIVHGKTYLKLLAGAAEILIGIFIGNPHGDII